MKYIFDGDSLVLSSKITTPLGDYVLDPIKESVKEWAAEYTREVIIGGLIALRDIVVDLIGAVSLVGCGLLILLKVAGYDNGYKNAGVLFFINVIVKFILV